MTALAHLRARLDEVEAGPAVIAVAVFLAASTAACVLLGQAGLDVVLIATLVLLIWNAGIDHSRRDEALDRSDKALSTASDAHLGSVMALAKSTALENVLTGNEPPSTGRHTRRPPPSPTPGGRP